MKAETITIQKEEYLNLKKNAKYAEIDREFIRELIESISDIKKGRVIQVR